MGAGWGEEQLTHADVVLAAVAPDVIGHLKPTQAERTAHLSLSARVLPGCPCLRLWLQLRGKGVVTVRALPDDEDALGRLPSRLSGWLLWYLLRRAMLCGKEEGRLALLSRGSLRCPSMFQEARVGFASPLDLRMGDCGTEKPSQQGPPARMPDSFKGPY